MSFANILPSQIYLYFLQNSRLPDKKVCMYVRDQKGSAKSKMSILKYLHPLKQKQDLPDSSGPLSEKIPSTAIASANVKVLEALEEGEENKRKSQGPYLSLPPDQKYEIGKRAVQHGVTASIRYYNKKYPDLTLKETTVRRSKIKEQLPGLY